MFRRYSLAALGILLTFAACQPQKTPEQVQAEQMAAMIGKAAAMAGAASADMTPEQRARLQAIGGAMASGQMNPAAAAYMSGANKAFDLLMTVKDLKQVDAVKPQVMAVYAEMAGPAAALKAMTEQDREIAFGSAASPTLTLLPKVGTLMSGLSYNPEMLEAVGKLLDQMPQPE